MREEITALTICIVAAIIIIIISVVIIRQKRREERNESADTQDVTPPVLTITLASSNFTARLDRQDSRPGLAKSLSERSGVDVWELRKEDRRQYIIDNIIYKVCIISPCMNKIPLLFSIHLITYFLLNKIQIDCGA